MIFVFFVFGFGVIFGVIWVEEVWGCYWGWDFKEMVFFVVWVVYVVYLYVWLMVGWWDCKVVWINVVGFVVMVFNLFFVNLVIVGLYLYVGVG